MPLDPQAQRLLDIAKASVLPPITAVPISEARKRMAAALTYTGEPEHVHRLAEFMVPGPAGELRMRMYRPNAETVLPGVIFFHGGGWVLNSIETHDHLCRALANLSGCAVLALDYRLAPEYPYPAAVEDAMAAVQWVSAHSNEIGLDPDRLGVAGDSSGATLASIVSQRTRDELGPALLCQALMYPVADHWTAGTRSYEEVGKGYSLSRELMIWFWEQYLPAGININDPSVSPLRATSFKGLPPTLVVTAEYDPLRDEGEQYAQELLKAGIPVISSRYSGMMHGFIIQFRVLDKGRQGLEESAAFLRRYLKK